MRLNILHTCEIDNWVAKHHYLKSVPAGAVLRMEVVNDDGERIGAMLWGRPTARALDQTKLLQLTRMYMIDETPMYAESQALAMARKYIRTHKPAIKGLITYASTTEGHEGTIYLADGWAPLGRTAKNAKGWLNRGGRTNRDSGVKLRFVRTP